MQACMFSVSSFFKDIWGLFIIIKCHEAALQTKD